MEKSIQNIMMMKNTVNSTVKYIMLQFKTVVLLHIFVENVIPFSLGYLKIINLYFSSTMFMQCIKSKIIENKKGL